MYARCGSCGCGRGGCVRLAWRMGGSMDALDELAWKRAVCVGSRGGEGEGEVVVCGGCVCVCVCVRAGG